MNKSLAEFMTPSFFIVSQMSDIHFDLKCYFSNFLECKCLMLNVCSQSHPEHKCQTFVLFLLKLSIFRVLFLEIFTGKMFAILCV